MKPSYIQRYKPFNFNDYRSVILEAIVRPEEYVSDLLSKIDKIEYALKKKEYSLKSYCKLLSTIFRKNHIEFVYEEGLSRGSEYYIRYGINSAATNSDKYSTIRFYMNAYLLKIKTDEDYKIFKRGFSEVLKHELVHRGQNLKVKDEMLRAKVMIQNYNGNEKRYLADKKEIMARAWEIVEGFRIRGASSEYIKNFLSHKNAAKLYSNNTLAYYHLYFDNDSDRDVLKLLYKYMYPYLDSD